MWGVCVGERTRTWSGRAGGRMRGEKALPPFPSLIALCQPCPPPPPFRYSPLPARGPPPAAVQPGVVALLRPVTTADAYRLLHHGVRAVQAAGLLLQVSQSAPLILPCHAERPRTLKAVQQYSNTQLPLQTRLIWVVLSPPSHPAHAPPTCSPRHAHASTLLTFAHPCPLSVHTFSHLSTPPGSRCGRSFSQGRCRTWFRSGSPRCPGALSWPACSRGSSAPRG